VAIPFDKIKESNPERFTAPLATVSQFVHSAIANSLLVNKRRQTELHV
jgi:hypothetical protein